MRLKYPVILASSSPRRKELLSLLVQEFEVIPAHLEEDSLTLPDPWQTAQRLAREKALTVFESHPNHLVIAGDTVVALPIQNGYLQFAKPQSEQEATRMLMELSGNTHLVVTGVALRWPKGMIAFTEETRVTFRAFSEADAEAYVATGEPMDKAGAYGIQGMASTLVSKLEGSLHNVIGLPTERLEEALRDVK